MKALHVLERIAHYAKVWLFVAAGVLVAFSLFNATGLVTFDGEAIVYDANGVMENLGLLEVEALPYAVVQLTAYSQLPMLLVVVALVFWALEHIFKQSQRIHAHNKGCCSCKCEEGSTDAQVEKIMKWKDLYNEGIITEREFIQKRNEILGLHK